MDGKSELPILGLKCNDLYLAGADHGWAVCFVSSCFYERRQGGIWSSGLYITGLLSAADPIDCD